MSKQRSVRAGDVVAVRDAFGNWLEKVATSDPMMGGDFAVVWCRWPDEPEDEGTPWPLEDVSLRDTVKGWITRAQYEQFLASSGEGE